MKKHTYLLVLGIFSFCLISCKSSSYIQTDKHSSKNNSTKQEKIVFTAKNYIGTPYKWGGTTKKGMDCSGLIYTSFTKNNVNIPRTTEGLTKVGKKIPLKKAALGDFLFFKTVKSKKTNHVAMVIENKNNNIKFIHSTTSKGVIISSIKEKYWRNSYTHTIRVFNN